MIQTAELKVASLTHRALVLPGGFNSGTNEARVISVKVYIIIMTHLHGVCVREKSNTRNSSKEEMYDNIKQKRLARCALFSFGLTCGLRVGFFLILAISAAGTTSSVVIVALSIAGRLALLRLLFLLVLLAISW